MSTMSPAPIPSRPVAAFRFVLAWVLGIATIAALIFGALWVWRLHQLPTAEVHDMAGILNAQELEAELEALPLSRFVHIAVLTMDMEATSEEEAKEEVKNYALSHSTEKPWVYEDTTGSQWEWADGLIMLVLVPNQNAALMSHGAFIDLHLSPESLLESRLSPDLPADVLGSRIVAKVSQAQPSSLLPDRPWWQKLLPLFLGGAAIVGLIAALGAILNLRDNLRGRTALVRRLRALEQANAEDRQSALLHASSSSEVSAMLRRVERDEHEIEACLREVLALQSLSVAQMSSEAATERLEEVQRRVVALESSDWTRTASVSSFSRVEGWERLWAEEVASIYEDCQAAQAFLDNAWGDPLVESPVGSRVAAIPDEVVAECERVGAAFAVGEIEGAEALEALRRCDERLRRLVLVEIPDEMALQGYTVPPFNDRFDDKVIEMEEREPDPQDEDLRENLMRYRLAEEPPRAVAGCSVAHYVSVRALVRALQEWVRRPDPWEQYSRP